eukprot:1833055-Pleurochrysis_carterae.AAC.2
MACSPPQAARTHHRSHCGEAGNEERLSVKAACATSKEVRRRADRRARGNAGQRSRERRCRQ